MVTRKKTGWIYSSAEWMKKFLCSNENKGKRGLKSIWEALKKYETDIMASSAAGAAVSDEAAGWRWKGALTVSMALNQPNMEGGQDPFKR